MKTKKGQNGSVVEPLLKGLLDLSKANIKTPKHDPSAESTPSQAPDLYQDSGGAYNAGFTFPQE